MIELMVVAAIIGIIMAVSTPLLLSAATLAAIRSIRVQITTQMERGAAPNSPGDQHTIAAGRVRLRHI